jgi:hypothetical protein
MITILTFLFRALVFIIVGLPIIGLLLLSAAALSNAKYLNMVNTFIDEALDTMFYNNNNLL